MSDAKIGAIIEAMRHERYRFTPAADVHPEENGKMRPLGMPTWSDKLAGEVGASCWRRTIEPQFPVHMGSAARAGAATPRCGRVEKTWTGTTWFIEGDISDCFGSLDHEMVRILSEKIHDNRFLRLIRNMSRRVPGRLEIPRNPERCAARRGGVAHPIEHLPGKLDIYVETVLIPHIPEGKSGANPDYVRMTQVGRAATTVTGRKPGNTPADARPALRRSTRPRLPADCTTPVTPTITSWVSPGRKPKPRAQKSAGAVPA